LESLYDKFFNGSPVKDYNKLNLKSDKFIFYQQFNKI
jgi:hypothetical protein